MRRLLVAALLVVSTGASFSGIESLQSIDDLFAAEFPLVTDVALDETSDDTDLDLDALMESPESAYRSLDFQPSWMESIESTANQPQRHPNAPHPSQGTDDDVLEPEPAALRGHGASSPQQPSTRFQRTPQGISNAPPTPPQGTKVPSWPPQGPNAPSTPQQGTSVEQRLQEYLNAWKPKYTLDNTEKACVKQHLVKYRRWIEPNTNNNDPRDEPLLSYLYKPGEGRKTFSSWLDADRHYAAASCFLKLRAVKKLEQEWSTVAQDFKILEKNQYWLFKGHVKRSIAQHEAERAASRLQAKLPPLMHNKHKLFKNLMKMAEFSHFNRAVTARFKKIIAKAKFTPARAPLDLWDAMNSIHTAFRRFKEQAVTLTKYNAEKWAWISSLRECYVDRCSPARKQSLLDSQFMDISILQYDTWHNWIDAAYVLTSNTPDWVNSSGTCCNQFFMNNAGEERACNVKTLIKVSCGRSAPCLLSAFGDRERQYAGSSYTLENALVPLDVLGRPTDNPSKSVHQTSYCPAEICALSMVQAIDAMWSHGFCELRQHAAKQFDVAGISDVDFDDVRIPCIPSEPTADGLRRMPLASSVCEHVGLSADELQSINGSYSCWLGAQKKARVSVVRFCCVLDNVEMTLSAY